MPTQSYWGNFQITDEQPAPVRILKEQAGALNEKVDHRIRAWVDTSPLSDTPRLFRSTLAVTVPSLDRYRLDIVTIVYPLTEYYPLTLSDDLADEEETRDAVTCKDGHDFHHELYRILSSKRTTNTLNSLLSLAA